MTNLNALSEILRGLLGPGFGVGVSDPRTPSDPLWPAEKTAIVRAIPKRVLEFTAGRTAARMAMADINLPPAAIPIGADRAPLWPDNIIGSIAHCNTAAIAAIAPQGAVQSIGLDIEENTPLANDLWDTICTDTERNWLARQPAAQQGTLAKQIFSAKEAAYKAQYPLTGALIGFEDVEISLAPQRGRFTASFPRQTGPNPFGDKLTGRLFSDQMFILASQIIHS